MVPQALQRRTTFLVERLALVLRKRSATALAALGLSQRQYAILCCVQELRACSHTRLSEYMGVGRADLAEPVRRLLKAELLDVDVNDRDRRQDDICLTAAGEAVLALAEQRLDQAEGELFAALVIDERVRLGELIVGAIFRAGPLEEKVG